MEKVNMNFNDKKFFCENGEIESEVQETLGGNEV